MVHQQVVIAVRQFIREVSFRNPVIRKHHWEPNERGLGRSNFALQSLALADDCSTKDDSVLHNATSCGLTVDKVKIVPGSLSDETRVQIASCPASRSVSDCFREYFQCRQRVC